MLGTEVPKSVGSQTRWVAGAQLEREDGLEREVLGGKQEQGFLSGGGGWAIGQMPVSLETCFFPCHISQAHALFTNKLPHFLRIMQRNAYAHFDGYWVFPIPSITLIFHRGFLETMAPFFICTSGTVSNKCVGQAGGLGHPRIQEVVQ